jgi:hypothetical protein
MQFRICASEMKTSTLGAPTPWTSWLSAPRVARRLLRRTDAPMAPLWTRAHLDDSAIPRHRTPRPRRVHGLAAGPAGPRAGACRRREAGHMHAAHLASFASHRGWRTQVAHARARMKTQQPHPPKPPRSVSRASTPLPCRATPSRPSRTHPTPGDRSSPSLQLQTPSLHRRRPAISAATVSAPGPGDRRPCTPPGARAGASAGRPVRPRGAGGSALGRWPPTRPGAAPHRRPEFLPAPAGPHCEREISREEIFVRFQGPVRKGES